MRQGLTAICLNGAAPWTASRVDTAATQRGPLLVISGQRDNTVPRTVARAYEQQNRIGHAVTEFVQLHGRGHSLTIDKGWREMAQTALTFVARFL